MTIVYIDLNLYEHPGVQRINIFTFPWQCLYFVNSQFRIMYLLRKDPRGVNSLSLYPHNSENQPRVLWRMTSTSHIH